MAIPTFFTRPNVGQVTGTSGTAAVALATASCAVNDMVLLAVLQDGTGADATISAIGSPLADLAGTTSAATKIGTTFAVGSAAVAKIHIWLMRVAAATDTNTTLNSSDGNDLYWGYWVYRDVSIGTTLATVIENVTAGSTASDAATNATVADAGVTTLGVDRLAIQVIGISDDNAQVAFTSETGGDWTESTGEHASATGTDGSIGVQHAAMASAGTINGGTFTQADATDGWGTVGFAFIGTTSETPASLLYDPQPFRHLRSR